MCKSLTYFASPVAFGKEERITELMLISLVGINLSLCASHRQSFDNITLNDYEEGN